MDRSDAYMILVIVVVFIVGAFALGLRDKINARKALIKKLQKEYGSEPHRNYKERDREHLLGFYKNHREGFQIDDTTWNDLSMDNVYDRLDYCLSAAGEEYLYHMLRTPRQEDDFEDLEKKIDFFQKEDDKRLKIQLIFSEIGNNSKYSIYDYIDFLKKVNNAGNTMHYVMLVLLVASFVTIFFKFVLGFGAFLIIMVAQIITYFKIKGDIDPYLVTYGYIMRVIKSIDKFSGIQDEALSGDVAELKEIGKSFTSFKAFAGILLSPTRMNSSGNPLDLIMDYIRMVTHIDLIKFNQMYKEIMSKRDKLDRILEITGRIEACISIACFRASFADSYCVPEFGGSSFTGKELFHPLITDPVANDIESETGVLLTGSNASGKSTFLKTCAIDAILAQSIHTVLGRNYKAPLYRIYSSMALKDDIFEGDSYYIVEIKSIKRILDAALATGNQVLCFVDEVLRGTNTVERIAASTQILKKLSEEKVQCFAATHDIELTALLKDRYDIYHFEGDVTDNDVKFDYRIRKGPATTRNAIKLLGVLGYEKELVDDAQKMADGFLEKGSWEAAF
ncbi:hypothetical protein D6855_01245 [Butyrivibrio sp. CB08]|uniref:MutS-related protein n=1 Tax=Butyrivibrio sp. CB08 TaxID=2364879 RepID=UPI000EA9B766|nr:hypothetical protein [Butyrivibrio sp. CB08]RKM62075.1 hypothetical protein D6855_01245 [Butyrivibrio sp. CB08]